MRSVLLLGLILASVVTDVDSQCPGVSLQCTPVALDLGWTCSPPDCEPSSFNERVFRPLCTGTQTDPDNKWLIPDGAQVIPINECQTDSTTTETDLDSVQTSSTTVSGKLTIDILFIKFTIGSDYQLVTSSEVTSQLKVVQSVVNCTKYRIVLSDSDPSYVTLSNDFANDVSRLQVSGNVSDSYKTFVQKYGTHVITGLTIGAKKATYAAYDEQSVTCIVGKNFDVSVAIGALQQLAVFGDASLSGEQRTLISKLKISSSTVINVHTRGDSIGPQPPLDDMGFLDTDTWQTRIADKPSAIAYQGSLISDLLTSAWFRYDSRIATKQQHLKAFVTAYLNSTLKPLGSNNTLQYTYCLASKPHFSGIIGIAWLLMIAVTCMS